MVLVELVNAPWGIIKRLFIPIVAVSCPKVYPVFQLFHETMDYVHFRIGKWFRALSHKFCADITTSVTPTSFLKSKNLLNNTSSENPNKYMLLFTHLPLYISLEVLPLFFLLFPLEFIPPFLFLGKLRVFGKVFGFLWRSDYLHLSLNPYSFPFGSGTLWIVRTTIAFSEMHGIAWENSIMLQTNVQVTSWIAFVSFATWALEWSLLICHF